MYSVCIVPILLDIKDVHLKHAFVVPISFCIIEFEMNDTSLNRPVQITA